MVKYSDWFFYGTYVVLSLAVVVTSVYSLVMFDMPVEMRNFLLYISLIIFIVSIWFIVTMQVWKVLPIMREYWQMDLNRAQLIQNLKDKQGEEVIEAKNKDLTED